MKLLFAKAKWERWDQALAPFLADVAAAGFDATEIFLPALKESPAESRRLHRQHHLKLVAQIITEGAGVEDHLRCLAERFLRALEFEPVMINSHTGRDIWTPEENLRVFDKALELEARYGVPVCHETHRSRALYCAPAAVHVLAARPQLKITADFPHWLCVHESDLADQAKAVASAIQAAHYIHARVGHSEGPQVPDPRAPECQSWRDLSLGFWRRIVEARRNSGSAFLTIAPEFDPPPYMPVIPFTGKPTADAWEVNCWTRQWLSEAMT